MKTFKIMGVVLLSVLVVGLSAGLLLNTNSSSNSSKSGGVNTTKYNSAISEFTEELESQQAQIDALEERTFSQFYSHHFDVVLTLDQAFGTLSSTIAGYGGANHVDINFNVISNNFTPYESLSDMDGDGYIASAFGVYTVGGSPAFVFNAQLVYNGNIVIYVTNTTDGSINTLVVPNMSNFAVEDSVLAI